MRLSLLRSVLIISAISLLLIEGALQLVTSSTVRPYMSDKFRIATHGIANAVDLLYHCDLWWVRRIVSHSKNLVFSIYEPHPTRGWVPTPNLSKASALGTAIYSHNSYGHRSLTADYVKNHRVMLIGDSFTYGVDIGDEDFFGSVMSRRLPNADVINLGVGGYGPDQMLLAFEEGIEKFHPDIVFVNFIGDDLYRSSLRFRDFIKPRFHLTDGQLTLEPPITGATVQEVTAKLKDRAQFADVLLSSKIATLIYSNVVRAQMMMEIEPLNRAIFTRIKEVADRHGVPVVFVYLSFGTEARDASLPMTIGERMLSSFATLGWQTINTRPLFLANPDPRFDLQNHYQKYESLFLTDILLDKIRHIAPDIEIN